MDPSPPNPPTPQMEEDELHGTSSDEELELSRHRRDSVHYATIGEFLASLKGVKSLSLDDYLRVVRCPEMQKPGDGDPEEALARDSREQAKD